MNLAILINKADKEPDVKLYFNGEEIVAMSMYITNLFDNTPQPRTRPGQFEEPDYLNERAAMNRQRRGRHD